MVVPTFVSFSIQAGEAFPREPYLRAWESREGLGILHGMAQVVGGPPKQVSTVVWEGIEEGLRQERLTVTRYLQAALLRAHQHLQQYAGRDWRAGATLVSVRDSDLYVARVGPSLTYLASRNRLVRLGAASEGMHGIGPALGEPKDPIPHIDRQTLHEGDVFLMAWTGLGQLTSENALGPLLATGVENASQSLFRLAKGEKDFAVLLAGFAAAPAAARP